VTVDESRRAGVEANQSGVKLGMPAATGDFTVEMVEKARPRHRRHRCTCARARTSSPAATSCAGYHPQVFRPHHPAHRHEEGRVGQGQGRAGDDRRRGNRQPGNALWVRSKSDISDEQYKEFYKHVAHDFEDPLAWTHARVEGKQEYAQLLYIPSRAPFDLWDRNARHGIKLYVRRVFIMDDAEQLMPLYLRFVRGVVDSSDLPLNVSREILQQSKDIDGIRSGCTRKVLSMLEDLAGNDQEKYAKFWEAFGAVLKEGVGEDHVNKEKIAGLIRFASTHNDTPEQTVSLADYIGRMKEGQEKIYFVTADTFNAAKNSPHLEIFRKKGIEVLLLSDRVDEWVVGHLTEFDGKHLQSVAKGGLDLGKLEDEAEKKEVEKAADEYKDLIDKVKASLGDKVKDVRITHRLTDSPACLVADEHDPSGNLARLMKAAGQPMPSTRPILEINPQHPAVMRLKYEEARFADRAALALRAGDPGRRWPTRRPGRFRQAHQRPDDGPVGEISRFKPFPGRLLRSTAWKGQKSGPRVANDTALLCTHNWRTICSCNQQGVRYGNTQPSRKAASTSAATATCANCSTRAATYLHVSVSEFVLSNALASAEKVVQANERITLSPEDFQAFLAALDSPAKPNASLQRAFDRHEEQVSR
jgi:molecular chaperone HtpG